MNHGPYLLRVVDEARQFVFSVVSSAYGRSNRSVGNHGHGLGVF